MSAVVRIESTGLVKYDAMQKAIVLATSVDEVKEIKDRATALEKYAKLAKNFDAERRCARIRIEAATKGGALVREQLKAKGGATKGAKKAGPRGKVTASMHVEVVTNLSKDERAEWQQLAQNPDKVKAYLDAEDEVPSIAGALAAVQPVKRVKPKPKPLPFTEVSLEFVGALRQISWIKASPSEIASGADEPMREVMRSLITSLVPYLQSIRKLL